MKKVIIGLMLISGLVWGQAQGINTLLISSPAPTGVQLSYVTNIGATGQTNYCYFVIAVFPSGMGSSVPVCTASANGTLDGSNYNTITWNPPPGGGVTGYWVVRSSNPSFPSTGTFAVNNTVLSASTLTLNDQSNTLNAFTFAPANWVNAYMGINNVAFSQPVIQISGSDGSVFAQYQMVVGGINGLNVVSGTAGNPLVLGLEATTDTNVGIQFQPKGTGPFSIKPTGNTGVALEVYGVASAVNGIMIQSRGTGVAPIIGSNSTGAEANIGVKLTSNGSGTVFISTEAGAVPQFNVTDTASAVNVVSATGAVTTGSPVITTTGSDAAIDLQLSCKGAGCLSKVSGVDYHYTGNLTIAQVNSGTVIVPAVVGRRWRLVEFTLQALGGNFATCTDVRITDTTGTPVVAITAPISTLTANTFVGPGTTNVTYTTFAWQGQLGQDQGIQIIKTGSSCATATSLNYNIALTLN